MLLSSRSTQQGAGDFSFGSAVGSRLLPAVQSLGGILQKRAPQVKKVDYKVTYKSFVVRTPPADPNWPKVKKGQKCANCQLGFPVLHETTSAYLMKEKRSESACENVSRGTTPGPASVDQRVSVLACLFL